MEKSAEFQQISDLIYCASNALKDLAGKKDLLLDEWDYRIELFPTSGATQLEAEYGEMAAALEGVEMVGLRYGEMTRDRNTESGQQPEVGQG